MGTAKEDVFIQQLLEETYEFLPERETSRDSSDLLSYFNCASFQNKSAMRLDQLKGTLQDIGVKSWFELSYEPPIKCFNLKMGKVQMHIPRNWGVFLSLYQSMKEGRNDLVVISKESDREGFLDAITPPDEEGVSAMLIHCYGNFLIAFNENSNNSGDMASERIRSILGEESSRSLKTAA